MHGQNGRRLLAQKKNSKKRVTKHTHMARAPTLQLPGTRLFEPVAGGPRHQRESLVCTAFNADFDGDQMGRARALSVEAQREAHMLMLASGNL